MNDPARMVAMLAAADAGWLGRWRTLAGYEACEVGDRVWVRGSAGPEWGRLPALMRFSVDAVGRLTPIGARVPTARVPDGLWQPLTEFMRVRPPAAALPALQAAPVAWSLVPSEDYFPADMIVLPCAEFIRWGLSAPAVRLKPLRFAVSADGRACVTGTVLPALPATPWRLQGRIATPAGWALPKGITHELVAATMKLATGEIALIHPDGTAERLPSEAFVEASRSALRATAGGQENPIARED